MNKKLRLLFYEAILEPVFFQRFCYTFVILFSHLLLIQGADLSIHTFDRAIKSLLFCHPLRYSFRLLETVAIMLWSDAMFWIK